MFLIRMEKMVAWVQVLESGFGYFVVHIKGLELQEPTSCHHVIIIIVVVVVVVVVVVIMNVDSMLGIAIDMLVVTAAFTYGT